MKKSTIRTIISSIALIAIIVLLALYLTSFGKPEEIKKGELEQKIEDGVVAEIFIKGSTEAYILYTNGNVDPGKFPGKADARCYIGSRTELENTINRIRDLNKEDWTAPIISYDNPARMSFWMSLIPILGIVIIAVLFVWMYNKSQGGNSKVMNFSKTKAKLNTNIKIRFADVAGAEEEKEELAEIVEFLKNPKKFSELGARIPKGVLLVGPPGTGKTLFAKAIAGEAGVPFFSISGSDFVEMFVGTGAARVRDMFEQAKKNMPCIIFIDEIDAVGRQRGTGLGGGHDEREQTLNQLLVQMDGFEHSDGIIIMAATNRADILDPALLRPGRFDRQIAVNPPDVKGREAIFKVHSRNKPLSNEVDFKKIARLTTGFTGADIENLLNEAAILAARKGLKLITMIEINEAINKVIAGPQKKSHVVSETDKRITAFHESGHAIVGQLLPYCDNVHEVSIIPRGMAAGYTITRPENDDQHVTKNKLQDTIAMMLAGRAAEDIIIQDISTGASNDIQRASGIARKMVTEWGMSEKLGNFFLGTSQEVFIGRDFGSQHQYSEKIAGIIDQEVKEILDKAYKRAIKILNENKEVLNNMVKVLFEKETIYGDEVQMLFEGKTAQDVIEYSKKRDKELLEKSKNTPKKNDDLIVKDKDAEIKPANPTDVKAEEKTEIKSVEKVENSEPKKEEPEVEKENQQEAEKPETDKKVKESQTAKKETEKKEPKKEDSNNKDKNDIDKK